MIRSLPIRDSIRAFPYQAINRASFIFLLTMLFSFPAKAQQAISGIVTDYNGYWASSATAINVVKPANNHNLLAFTYNGTQYSTGVNDGILRNNNQNFVSGDFWSFPVEGFSGAITSNTKVGLGEMYDGVHNGRGVQSPDNDPDTYLTDGVKGLNIGTCVANIPAGTMNFIVSNIKPEHIGDGIPDIVVTQMADPSGSTDRYAFTDASGNMVGQYKDIIFTSITPVGQWTADFYEASTNPMILAAGFTNTDRDIRLWAADLSEFGITSSNYASIQKFRINLSGNSDVAFVAYNSRTFNVASVLPVRLNIFSGKEVNGNGVLSWQTESESETSFFVVEKRNETGSFNSIDTIAATGNIGVSRTYSCTDRHLNAGVNYYRLKMIDRNGYTEYSKVVMITGGAMSLSLTIYPNPATERVYASNLFPHAEALLIYNSSGIIMSRTAVPTNATTLAVDLKNLSKGIYYMVCQGSGERSSASFVIR